MTSSPGSTPATIRQRCSAAVPVTVATAKGEPVKAASSASKRRVKPPSVETQFVSRVSLM